MERRREPRIEAHAPVIVTELGPHSHSMGGVIQDLSGTGMRIKLMCRIALNAPVKVETRDLLVLGEVTRCEQIGAEFDVGLILLHSLKDLAALESLNRALLGEGRTPPAQKAIVVPTPIMRE